MTFTTLGNCKANLWQYARVQDNAAVPYSARTTADELAFTAILNRVCERFQATINFKGAFTTARLRVFDEQITLPSPLEGLRSLRIVNDGGDLGAQFQVFSMQANFSIGSCYLGFPNAVTNPDGLWANRQANGGVRDLGDGFATFRDGSGTYYVRCKSTQTEVGGTTILLRGLDENGSQIYTSAVEGVSIAVTTTTTTTTQKFTELSSWTRSAASNGVIQLFAVDTTTGEETALVNITPNKLVSGYRRYSARGFAFGQTVEALCNVAILPAVVDNDLVMPGNLGALKLGMMALQYEDRNDLANAALYMGPNYPQQNPGKPYGALDLLESERDQFDGDEVSNVVFVGFERTTSFAGFGAFGGFG